MIQTYIMPFRHEINLPDSTPIETLRNDMTSLPEEQTRIDELLAEVKDWQLLQEMSGRLMQVLDLDKQLAILLNVSARLAGSEQGLISLYSSKLGRLQACVSQGLNDGALTAIARVEVGDGACGLAFQTCARVEINDTETDPRYADSREYARTHGIRSVLSIPFFETEGVPLGVVSIYQHEPCNFSERLLKLLDACASQAGLLVSRAHAEKALSKERTRSDQVLGAISDGYLVMDKDFRILQLNAAALRMDGRTSDELVGLTHWEAWPGSENLELGQHYRNAMASRTAVHFEQWYEQQQERRCYDISAQPFSDGLALFYTDVTAQRLAESEIRTSEQRFFNLANTIPQLAWIAHRDGSIYWYNDRWYSYTGTIPSEMLGWKWQSVHDPELLPTVMERWQRSIKSGEAFEMAFPLRGADGIFRPFYTLVSPLRDASGKIIEWFGTNTDISALAEADKRKDEFLAMLAHELRNPLSPISSAAQLLTIPGISPERVQHASRVINRQVVHMTELIDDLLDVSRVTRGLITLDKKALDVATLLNDAIEQVRPLIDARQQKLSLYVEPRIPQVLGDQTRLIQVLVNVINNASKYSPQASQVAICVRNSQNYVAVSVEDEGIGISAELLPRVFDLFAQAERTPDRAQGGLGLGLAIVKKIVELHGGRVAAKSEGVGRGAVFEISIPALPSVPRPTPAVSQAARPTPIATLKIAIVDDNQDSAEALRDILNAQGHEVTLRFCGQMLLESLHTMEAQDAYILDIGLPGMDGYQLVNELLKIPVAAKATMIALTGYGQSHDVALGKLAGFHHYFVKPVRFDELSQVLSSVKVVPRN